MRRRSIMLLLFALLIASSATGVSASTDCQRWITAYRAQLAQNRAIKRMQLAHARVKHYAKHKLAGYVAKKPHPAQPKVIRVHSVRPRYTRRQILDRFNLLCGDLPETQKLADRL
ncbi:MAG: hypothetical protein KGK08_14015, partial [Acidobacteriota bacterium]|nr:hypothetical protein [Acidobacteriota bacterium]